MLYFLHVPKAGGNTFRSTFHLNSSEHKPLINNNLSIKYGYDHFYFDKRFDSNKAFKINRIELPISELSANCFVAIVRNPYSLLYSIYNFSFAWGNHTDRHKALGSFKTFITDICMHKKTDGLNKLYPLLEDDLFFQLNDANGARLKNLIILRTERLSDDIVELNERYKIIEGISPAVGHLNKQSKTFDEYKEHYDDEMKKMFEIRFRKELDEFNYNFDGLII